jgi:hypothetical protein
VITRHNFESRLCLGLRSSLITSLISYDDTPLHVEFSYLFWESRWKEETLNHAQVLSKTQNSSHLVLIRVHEVLVRRKIQYATTLSGVSFTKYLKRNTMNKKRKCPTSLHRNQVF